MLEVFALLIIVILVVVACVAAAVLGALPGKIARTRSHPQADAIAVCGWLGLLTLGILWPAALIWAYTQPLSLAATSEVIGSDRNELFERVTALEDEVRRLATQKGGARS